MGRKRLLGNRRDGTFYLVSRSRLHQWIIRSWIALNLKSAGRPASGASYLPEVLCWCLVLHWCPQSYLFTRAINVHEILKVHRQGHLHRSYRCGSLLLLHSQHTREPSHCPSISHFTDYKLGSLRRVGNPLSMARRASLAQGRERNRWRQPRKTSEMDPAQAQLQHNSGQAGAPKFQQLTFHPVEHTRTSPTLKHGGSGTYISLFSFIYFCSFYFPISPFLCL